MDLSICCPNLGCEQECAKSEMAEHAVKCDYKSIPCVDPNCEDEGISLRGLVDHLKAGHDATELVCNDGVVSVTMPRLHSTSPNVSTLSYCVQPNYNHFVA